MPKMFIEILSAERKISDNTNITSEDLVNLWIKLSVLDSWSFSQPLYVYVSVPEERVIVVISTTIETLSATSKEAIKQLCVYNSRDTTVPKAVYRLDRPRGKH